MIDYENLEKWKIFFYFFVVLEILPEEKHIYFHVETKAFF